jgi:RNA polymerase sigma-70 factor (ECF subfamily)
MFAAKIAGNMDFAREIVQDLFVYLWENRKDICINYSMKSYLTTSVRRNSIRFIQQPCTVLSIDTLTDSEDIAETLSDPIELEELHRQLQNAIESLPAQCRKIFKLSRFRGLKYAEIAEQLGISVKTVEAQIGKALRLLREKAKLE